MLTHSSNCSTKKSEAGGLPSVQVHPEFQHTCAHARTHARLCLPSPSDHTQTQPWAQPLQSCLGRPSGLTSHHLELEEKQWLQSLPRLSSPRRESHNPHFVAAVKNLHQSRNVLLRGTPLSVSGLLPQQFLSALATQVPLSPHPSVSTQEDTGARELLSQGCPVARLLLFSTPTARISWD